MIELQPAAGFAAVRMVPAPDARGREFCETGSRAASFSSK